MNLRIKEYCFGTVRSVDGSEIVLRAEKLKVENGKDYLHVEVGAFVNCGGFHGDTICIVTRIQIEEVEKRDGNTKENKIVNLSVVGSLDGKSKFTRGVDQLPPISCDSYLLKGEQINYLLGIDDQMDDENKKKYFNVGRRSMKGAGDVYFDLDRLLGRHVAILGTTGSGKSSTVARIAQSILRDYPYPRLIFFDVHNEYQNAFSKQWEEKANCIEWSKFSLPYWFLDLEEFINIYYPSAGGTQKMYIKDLIEELKSEQIEDVTLKERISVDSPIFFDIDKLIKKIEEKKEDSKTKAADKDTFNKIILKIKSINDDTRFSFLKTDKESQLSLGEYFTSLFGIDPENQKYISVLDLSGLPTEVRAICVGVLARLCFDYCYWDIDPENLPISLILEEAHTYIPEENSSEYSLCLQRIEKIAKEGRKYGISLVVVSQRPSNVSSTVLSQCGTFITLRLTSDLDQNKIRRLLPDTLGDQANVLPSLRDGEALVTGDAMLLPGKVYFEEPNPRPKSNDVRFHKAWTKGIPKDYDIQKIIRNWQIREKSSISKGGVNEN
ncbi:ATP-binding protein [Clostridium sp. C2-6-12]|uniref:ATP-binding protein n=1 Tax=Clostridium sp. C2-6-12 TaxID=2698832 RepID=UPI00136AB01B|nr:ATP-binding protein [Clostridium sp. C2-6-12]